MRIAKIGFATVSACVVVTAAPAYAGTTTLTFDFGQYNTIYSSPLTQNGYQFGNDFEFHIIQGGAFSTPDDGTDVLMSHEGPADISKVGGGYFEMLSVEVANSGSRDGPAPGMSISGYLNGVLTGTITTSLTDSFISLDGTSLGVVDSVEISGTGPWYSNGFVLDNAVLIDAIPPVPEPSTWTLMLLGFGAIGAAMRRIRKANTLPQLA